MEGRYVNLVRDWLCCVGGNMNGRVMGEVEVSRASSGW